jgi:methylation protein EvaC
VQKCLICTSQNEPFMSFGPMPIANGFITEEAFDTEYFYEMEVMFCEWCKTLQLVDQPDRDQMFNSSYAFFSGTSRFMAAHFERWADQVVDEYLGASRDPFVVEMGSNDGILMKHFAKREIRHLGIEPSANVAEIAMGQGVNTVIDFFDKELAETILSEYGQADVYLAANVMCHTPYINSIVEGIKVLLKADGLVVFEDPYLGDVVEKTTYDQIYDEHTFLYSVHSVQHLFAKFGMEIVDVQQQNTHGGSMRYVIANETKFQVSTAVGKQLAFEKSLGLTEKNTFEQFARSCAQSRSDLLHLLRDLKREGKSIVGYAATSKSTTVMNYCSITADILDCIYDTTPIKQGKFSPGMHIPIVDHAKFKQNYPDYAVLFGYNHEQEIMEKEQEFMKQGGKWITYVPKVAVVG